MRIEGHFEEKTELEPNWILNDHNLCIYIYICLSLDTQLAFPRRIIVK